MIIHLYFLIPVVILQIFISTAELALPTGTQTNETNTELKTQTVSVEAKISKCYTQFEYLYVFYVFHLLNHYVYFF